MKIEQIAQDRLECSSGLSENGEERQQQLHKAALESAGSIQGNDPNRAESARSEVRSRIAQSKLPVARAIE